MSHNFIDHMTSFRIAHQNWNPQAHDWSNFLRVCSYRLRFPQCPIDVYITVSHYQWLPVFCLLPKQVTSHYLNQNWIHVTNQPNDWNHQLYWFQHPFLIVNIVLIIGNTLSVSLSVSLSHFPINWNVKTFKVIMDLQAGTDPIALHNISVA